VILAGSGFRTEPAAHAEAAQLFRRPVIGLELVDPRFYHLDTALFVLDDDLIAYYPDAFSADSQALLRRRYPDALLADETDALAFGLNALSDGRHVFLPAPAEALAKRIADAGYQPVPVSLGELLRGGGSVKCCTLELRR
jgi:N-dimethylarginine dimethylaminohydrolase